MTEHEIAIKLNDHFHEISSLKHRTDELEEKQEVMNSLVRNVDRLASNMENMLKEQQLQRKEIDALKQGPADEYKHYKRLIIGCIITGVVGALLGAVLSMIIH